MKNYIIPYGERSTRLENGFCTKRELFVVDNVGLVVLHSKDKLTQDLVRPYLIGWNEHHKIHIQANSLSEAIKKFYDFPECKTGCKYKAWELVDSESNPIIEYDHCIHLYIKNWLSCTYYNEPGDENYNMVCILDGLDDPPIECPIQKQIEHIKPYIFKYGGIWCKTFN